MSDNDILQGGSDFRPLRTLWYKIEHIGVQSGGGGGGLSDMYAHLYILL